MELSRSTELLLLLAMSCHNNLVHSLIQYSVDADSLLITLYDVQDMIGELRQDIAHKIGHVDHKQSLRHMENELQSISLESLPLTKLTVDVIQSKMDSATLHIKDVMDNMTDLRNLQKILHRLKELEFEMKELAIRIEEELEAQESDSTSTIVLQQEIAKLADELKQQQQKEINRQRPYEVIEGIQTREFEEAQEKLNTIPDDVKITLIIRTVYDHHIVNFNLLTDFARFLTNKTKTFFVTKTLWDQLNENRHNDALRILEVKKIANSIDVNSVLESERKGLEQFNSELRSAVVKKAKEELIAALKQNAHKKGTIKETFKEIYQNDGNAFSDAVKGAMNDAYLDFQTNKWLELSRDSFYIQENILISSNVWDKMHQHDQMGTSNVADIGYTMKEILAEGNYHEVSDGDKATVEKIKSELPFSIKNAVFSDKVCIRNLKYDEFLYSPIIDFKYDEDRRHVFTWNSTERDDSAEWQIDRIDDKYFIRNRKYNEFLYAANNFFIKYDRRRSIYTWMRGGRVTNGMWLIEPEGDYCYLKVTSDNEYLIAGDDEKKFDKDRRKVFGAVGGKKSEEAKWKIEAC